MSDILTTVVKGCTEVAPYIEDDERLALEASYNRVAFEELYRRHVNRVYGYILIRVGNVQDAQDLTAKTFLAALEGIAEYRARGSFAAWLLGIARHKVGDYFRQSRETLSLEEVLQLRDPAPPPDEAVRQRMQAEQVAGALRGLSPDRAEALSLRIFAGLNAAEIARVMGKNEAAIRMLIHRAVSDLRERLAASVEMET